MRKNKFPLGKILILVTILALPGFLYYLLKTEGKNSYKPLPIFGPKTVASTFHTKRRVKIPDTIYHQVVFPELMDVYDNEVSLKANQHKLSIVNFFYIKNTEIVPQINKGLKDLQKQFKDNKMIRIISLDIDPEHDDVVKLKAYADQLGAIPGKWSVIRADTAIVYPLARDQFFVNAFQTDNGNFIFSDKLILLDAENRIRGYYTGTSSDELRRISDEIKVQITEELRKIKAEL